MWRQFLTPLEYLRISLHGKILFDLVAPLALSAVCATVFLILRPDLNVLGNGGLLALSSGLLAALVGFFIAALAAVATFPNRAIDKPLDRTPAILHDYEEGVDEVLSRRRFLCYLFGYLSFFSLCIFIFNVSVLVVRSSLLAYAVAHPDSKSVLEYCFVSLYVFAFFHLACVCLLGLHFLIYRLHKPHVDNVRVK